MHASRRVKRSFEVSEAQAAEASQLPFVIHVPQKDRQATLQSGPSMTPWGPQSEPGSAELCVERRSPCFQGLPRVET